MSSEIGAMQAISLWAENERNSVQTKPTGNASSRPYRVKRICATYRTALLIPFSLSLFPYYPPLLSCSLPPEYTTPAPERRNRMEKIMVGAMPTTPSLPPDPVHYAPESHSVDASETTMQLPGLWTVTRRTCEFNCSAAT